MLTVADIAEMFEGEDDLRVLSRTLGSFCLDSETVAVFDLGHLDHTLPNHLRQTVCEAGLAVFPTGSRAQPTPPSVREALNRLGPTPELAAVMALRGLCDGALRIWFESTYDRFDLARGDPIPLPDRPTQKALGRVTPNPATLTRSGLLADTGFVLFEPHVLNVELDFSSRDLLDQTLWDGEASTFRLVASVHPFPDASRIVVDTVTPDWWFGARPTAPNPAKEIAHMLRLAAHAGASAALLPELCLHQSGDLAGLIAAEPDSFPTLVVAGSAHDESDGTRQNVSRVYLDGTEILRHSKTWPVVMKDVGPPHSLFAEPREEGLHPRGSKVTIACGSSTRFAIGICADLQNERFVDTLKHLRVNYFMLPALTPKAGAFTGSLAVLSAVGQSVCVVANGSPNAADAFLLLAAVPRDDGTDTVCEFTPEGSRQAVGLINLNEPLATAIAWLDASGQQV